MEEYETRILTVLRTYHKTWSSSGGLLLSEISILAHLPMLYTENVLHRLIKTNRITARLCDSTPKRTPFRRYYLAREAHLT